MDVFLAIFKRFNIISGEMIARLEKPEDFHSFISKKIEISEHVAISTLFIGNGLDSMYMFEKIYKRKLENLQTSIILDKNRLQRNPEAFKYLRTKKLLNIFNINESNFKNNFFSRIKEIFHVNHKKIFLFDSDILITGANMEDSYYKYKIDRDLSKKLYHQMFSFSNTDFIDRTEYCCPNIKIISFTEKTELRIFKEILNYNLNEIYISTAFLNFSGTLISGLKNRNVTIFTASPRCNTFKFNPTIEEIVKNIYTLNVIEILTKNNTVSYYEYDKENFYFHSKEDFCISIIGSSNYNVRSSSRDSELNFLVVSENKNVINIFENEIKELLIVCKKVTLEDLKARNVSFISKVLKPIFKNYL
ncbi:hypothetical protein CWI37_1634p0010 [Hamiltosporidium tvaerminnensis]|uniref:CDP-diacylglycerol--glycerol-3-phosphate 3-phosphatidyltransferase n=1 Tax=Hamiltosporidium tvaerminnensis TaxID=1176355 RepID=A0A4Q9KV05_9MICR|nr:hypothetical protein CWI37_1634p0010 [Hamiltosporidium tvaerminnensis]